MFQRRRKQTDGRFRDQISRIVSWQFSARLSVTRRVLPCILALCSLSITSGCTGSPEKDFAEREAQAVAKIRPRDRLRLTLADASAAGIYLFDLKLIREDIQTLTDSEPELAAALLADLDRVEALPKTAYIEKAEIGREMYERIKIQR